MMHNGRKIAIPKWISCHTYLFGKEESRTYISNERSHRYVLLDGLASDMWKLLSEEVSEEELFVWAQENGVTDQVDSFLAQLEGEELISFGEYSAGANAGYERLGDSSDNGEEVKFVEEMQRWLYENNFMYSLFFELTYRCNLKCVHCYNPKNIADSEIDFDMCKKAIDDAYSAGCFRITFSGGEAVLHNRFLDLVKYARSKRISVEIFTNGQILARDNDLYNDLLAQYPYRIGVSLYSTDEKTHEAVTAVKGSFRNTYELIERLREDNVNVQIKNFLLNINCADCIAVKRFAQKTGAMSVADISLIPTIEGDKKTLHYVLEESQLFELYTNIDSPLYVGADYKVRDYEKMKDSAPCFGGFTGLTVTPNGEVIICVSLPLSVGNLKETSLWEIWRAAAEKRKDSRLYAWREISVSDFEDCYKEEYCAYCDFCPGMGFLENGYLKKSEVLCAQAKVKKKAVDFLKEMQQRN